MEDYGLLLIILGVFLILLQIYMKVDAGFDDRYIAKKSSEEVLQERLKMNEEGKLNWFYQFDLYIRIFVSKALFLKIGIVLICIGIFSIIILKIIF
ncbi:hypothetical protein [Aliarcobacter vitoriensis]|uniref:Uncharacterized protein n=1 Tax=Aliarcobacter vitoriensis TaxID=2011099 RepID=A0A366MQ18_9BACT|nr:hypothetical protein [Aliarcobacter vitoriensis]RBQ28325.1 hypothetical protein CRU91_09555 [Aliarcobacter vitoriensis]